MKRHQYNSISANTLFHFTNSREQLLNILNVQFQPHYCIEDFRAFYPNLPTPIEIAIAMICFCDIPLANAKRHIDTYGSFGIGLSKEWGMKYGISPVLYTFPNATLGKFLGRILDFVEKSTSHNYEKLKDIRHISQDIFCHFKPYEGYLWRNGSYKDELIRFYDEREWRFVPEALRFQIPNIISKKECLNDNLRQKLHADLADCFRLEFEVGDIKYLIVENEDHVVPLLDSIREMNTRFNEQAVNLLATRIIRVDQLNEDI